MNEYFKMTTAGKRHAKARMFRKLFCLFLVLEVALFAGVVYFRRMSSDEMVGLGVVAALMLVVFSVRTWNNSHFDFRDWGLHLDDQVVYLTENPEGTTIHRNEVSRIVVSGSGMIVKGREFGKQIWIPEGVESYEDIKQKLQRWAKV